MRIYIFPCVFSAPGFKIYFRLIGLGFDYF